MLLYIDMDSTVFDYVRAYSNTHFEHTGDRILPTPSMLGKYHINDVYGIPDSNKYYYLTSEFFESMRPYNGAVESIDSIHKEGKFNIKFVTHLVTMDAYKGKCLSLRKHFEWFDEDEHLICMKDKHLLIPGVIIDDNPYVLEKSCGHHTTIAYDQPWNKHSKHVDYRACNWGEVVSVLDKIRGDK